MRAAAAGIVLAAFAICSGCGRQPGPPVESLSGSEEVSGIVLQSLRGTRDGERLDVQAVYGDQERRLSIELHINVTPPSRLETGAWTGLAGAGQVRQRSLTFLGGQSGPPSLGGRFDLLGPDERPLYRVTIPLQELRQPL